MAHRAVISVMGLYRWNEEIFDEGVVRFMVVELSSIVGLVVWGVMSVLRSDLAA